MQLEQSGFRIYKFFFSLVPLHCFTIAALTCLALLSINFLMLSQSNLHNSFEKCWLKLYQDTHAQRNQFFIQMLKDNNGNFSLTDLEENYKLVNSTTAIRIEMNPQMVEGTDCQIQYNFLVQKEQNNELEIKEKLLQGDPKNSNNYILGYATSVSSLLKFNLSNITFLQKHGISYHRIILPNIRSTNGYIGHNEQTSLAEQYFWETKEALQSVNEGNREKWMSSINESEWVQTVIRIKEDEAKDKAKEAEEQKKEQEKGEGQQQDRQKQNQGEKQEGKEKEKEEEKEKEKDQNSNEANQEEQNQKQEETVVDEKKIRLEVKKGIEKTKAFFSLINTVGKHSFYYRLESDKKWSRVELPLMGDIIEESVLIINVIMLFVVAVQMNICSIIVSIFLKYFFISLLTLLSLLGCGKFSKDIGWLHKYLQTVRNSRGRQIKLFVQITIAMIGMYTLFTLGFYLLIEFMSLILRQLFFPYNSAYSSFFLFTILISETAHYFFFRSRTSLKFYCIFSFLINIAVVMFISDNHFYLTSYLLNAHRLLNLFFIFAFMFLEKMILDEQFYNEYKPCLQKPRMLFYLGFDMDWHRGIPPIWTNFVNWYDMSYCSNKELAYLNQDYELLYGMLMGMDEPQDLPENEQEDEEQRLEENSSSLAYA